MRLESLLLDKALEAHMALVRPYVGVDEDVALHVGQQGKLSTADPTLVLLHSLNDDRLEKDTRCVFLFCTVCQQLQAEIPTLWVSVCCFRWCDWMNSMPHSLQMYGLMSLCFIMWF